jgi:hypothetical protein
MTVIIKRKREVSEKTGRPKIPDGSEVLESLDTEITKEGRLGVAPEMAKRARRVRPEGAFMNTSIVTKKSLFAKEDSGRVFWGTPLRKISQKHPA